MRAHAPAAAPSLATLALAALVLAAPAGGDEVHLLNGKSFEDVVARVEGDEVAIGLSGGGEIVLPMNYVARVVQSETTIETFRERSRELSANPAAGAEEWLELARWARERGLARAQREAAVEAARRAPELPGVAAAMRELDYVFEPESGEWLPRTELMARRGLVSYRGEWVSAEERDRRLLTASEFERELARDRRLERITRILETQVELELARGIAGASPQPAPPVAYPAPGYAAPLYATPVSPPIYVVPGFFPDRHHRSPSHTPRQRPAPPPAALPPSHHHGGRDSYVTPVDFTDFIPGRLNPDASPPPGQLGVR